MADTDNHDAVTLDRVRALPDRWRRLRANLHKWMKEAEAQGKEMSAISYAAQIKGIDACLSDLEGTIND